MESRCPFVSAVISMYIGFVVRFGMRPKGEAIFLSKGNEAYVWF